MIEIIKNVLFGVVLLLTLGITIISIKKAAVEEKVLNGVYKISCDKSIQTFMFMGLIFSGGSTLALVRFVSFQINLNSMILLILVVAWILEIYGMCYINNWCVLINGSNIECRSTLNKEKSIYFLELEKIVIKKDKSLVAYSGGKKVLSIDGTIAKKDRRFFLDSAKTYNVKIEKM